MRFDTVTAADISALMAIEQQCHSHPWTEKTMRSCLAGRYFNLAAFETTQMLGFYIGERAGPDFTLMDICVAPAFQGRGIAKQLLNKFIDYAEHSQAENIFLEVRESNLAAIKLYQQAGFIEMSVRKNYYPSTDPAQQGEDAILMALPLSL